ncbi:MAG: hypothetical protein Q7K65_01930 [Candidatus Buchananbacteria bacterium]|nr:hypothetical protein [Candidatus Buchananbacteria bacterium]
MPKSPESPKKYTPEEIADLEKSRTISDAELLKKGSKYEIDEEGNKHLVDAPIEDILERKRKEDLIELIKPLKSGDRVELTYRPYHPKEKGVVIFLDHDPNFFSIRFKRNPHDKDYAYLSDLLDIKVIKIEKGIL